MLSRASAVGFLRLVESTPFADNVSLWFHWEFSLKLHLVYEFPGNHLIDLNLSSLKWSILINCNWCISLIIVLILALMNTFQ